MFEEKNLTKKPSVRKRVHSKVSMNRLKILVTTVMRSKADFYMDYIQSFGANVQFVLYGHGTAPREIMTALGLADPERAVIISIIGEDHVPAVLECLAQQPHWNVGLNLDTCNISHPHLVLGEKLFAQSTG